MHIHSKLFSVPLVWAQVQREPIPSSTTGNERRIVKDRVRATRSALRRTAAQCGDRNKEEEEEEEVTVICNVSL